MPSAAWCSCAADRAGDGRLPWATPMKDLKKEAASAWLARAPWVAIACQASLKAAFFSATMSSNSLRSRSERRGPASAMRVNRWAMTWGAARASSAAWTARADVLARCRRVAMVVLVRINVARTGPSLRRPGCLLLGSVGLGQLGVAGLTIELLQFLVDKGVRVAGLVPLALEAQLDRNRLLHLALQAQRPGDHPVGDARIGGAAGAFRRRQRRAKLDESLVVPAGEVVGVAQVVAQRSFPLLRLFLG